MLDYISKDYRYLINVYEILNSDTGEGFINNILCSNKDEVEDFIYQSYDRDVVVKVFDLCLGKLVDIEGVKHDYISQ